jgi:fructose-1-phosphate kinase PfkB-like protein
MVKPNEYELAELMGADRPDEAFILRAGRQLNERIPVVIVTAGRRGAYCFADGKSLHAVAEIPSHQVTSTVGCGDAMMAGFLSGLSGSQGDVETALREGVAISAAAVLTDEPARFERADVERIRRRVVFRTVE